MGDAPRRHSQGGGIAQIVASRDRELAFAIINSGPGINAQEQDRFGAEHTLVPVPDSVRIFDEALAQASNDDVTLRVFPGADHRIRGADRDGFTDGYLETMMSWLHARVVPAHRPTPQNGDTT